ncbi:DUF5071 domain-containing protein [Aquimarina sp. U1-2]|uniref:DUF5071 domain-containing protein n=1 Tax=Aquimarina sp. U1-2 TaxID=2823141 RepID=UPI001AECCA27|nr:DUF5071 domain-containing protein [Aquimarina sp. U1-2]MBP2832615.1 DUF5071 domain-containing protein [Aquimarina sp. U1-2]
MNNKDLIPKDKADVDFIHRLNKKSIHEIRDILPKLLEWMQDINWVQAGLLYDYFSPFINEIDNEIISILETNDDPWKYSILIGLILNPSVKIIPNDKILSAIKKLHDNPSKDDLIGGNVELAEEILKKYKFHQK